MIWGVAIGMATSYLAEKAAKILIKKVAEHVEEKIKGTRVEEIVKEVTRRVREQVEKTRNRKF